MDTPFTFACPRHPDQDLQPNQGALVCPRCGQAHPAGEVVDLLGEPVTQAQTADHYTKQWGKELGFGQRLAEPKAQRSTVAATLPWEEFFGRVRAEAAQRRILVYDAACGWGGILTKLLAEPAPPGLVYLGADIHSALADAPRPAGLAPGQLTLARWDITKPLPVRQRFDYVICRSAVMITPDPPATVRSLAGSLRPGGRLAVSIYTRKAPMREAVDDALRRLVVPMGNDEAMEASRQLAALGRDLQACSGRVAIAEDLPFLGVKAGDYGVQEFIYDHLLKCWYNPDYGLEHSAAVNFDWYHPEYT